MGILGTPLGWIMYAIESFIHNYGLSLILFVLFTKICLLPLNIKQKKSTAKTMAVSPKLKELEKRCGKDKQKYQEEMMKLYEQEGINPMAGCLPMVVQFALLFGIIDVIYNPLKHLLHIPADLIKSASDLLGPGSDAQFKIIDAIQNGSTQFSAIFNPDQIEKIANLNIHILGINMSIIPKFEFSWMVLIPIISGLTALLMSVISMKIQEKNGQKLQGAMKIMMYVSPLMSVWFGFTLSVGVSIYWIISNVFSLAQEIVLSRIYSPEKLANMTDKSTERTREKMKQKREKMEAYNKMLEEKGMAPKAIPKKVAAATDEKLDKESATRAKEQERLRIAEARRKMAEKYGDEISSDDKE